LQATILPSPTPTLTPRPNVPETAVITLLGPPDESSLPPNGRLAFYWSYPAASPAPAAVCLNPAPGGKPCKSWAHWISPTLASCISCWLILTAIEPVVGTAVWQLQLQGGDEEQLLLTSEERQILFLPE
jgi:hypothetical protein